jgi:hypothetical protein
VNIRIVVFWVVTLCNVVDSEDGGDRFVRNDGNDL